MIAFFAIFSRRFKAYSKTHSSKRNFYGTSHRFWTSSVTSFQLSSLVSRWQWCWWHRYDGDRFEMLVAELCWRLLTLCWWCYQCTKLVTNISNLSPTHLVSNIRHQHRCNHSRLYVAFKSSIDNQHCDTFTNSQNRPKNRGLRNSRVLTFFHFRNCHIVTR